VIRRLGRALVRPASLAVLGLLFALLTAGIGWVYLQIATLDCSGATSRGSNIEAALALVAVGAPVAGVVIVAVRKRRRLLVSALLAAAALLGLAIVFVALDSDSYTVGECAPAHPGFLYFLWGATILFLVIQASRAQRSAG
jgi:hypothetical protein